MAGFVVSAAFKLVDQFSANADKIGAKADQLGNRMQKLKGKLSGFKKIALGSLAGVLAGLSVKNLLQEAADEEQLVNRFTFAFNNAKNRIKASAADMGKFLSNIVAKTGVDMEDLQGSIVAPLLMSSKLSGQQLSRSIQASVDLARFAGKSTAEEFEGIGRAMATAMQNPLSAQRLFRSIGLGMAPELKKSIALLVKHGDIVGAQSKILETIEAQIGGFGAKDTIGKTLMRFKNMLGDTAAVGGSLLYVFFGPMIDKAATKIAGLNVLIADFTNKLKAGENIEFSEIANKLWAAVRDAFSDVWAIVSEEFKKIADLIAPHVDTMTSKLQSSIAFAIESGIKLGFQAIPGILGELILSAVSKTTAAISDSASGVLNTMTGGLFGMSLDDRIKRDYPNAAQFKEQTPARLDGGVGSKPAEGTVKVDINVKADPNTKASTDVSSVGSGLKVGRTSAGRFTSDPMPLAY